MHDYGKKITTTGSSGQTEVKHLRAHGAVIDLTPTNFRVTTLCIKHYSRPVAREGAERRSPPKIFSPPLENLLDIV